MLAQVSVGGGHKRPASTPHVGGGGRELVAMVQYGAFRRTPSIFPSSFTLFMCPKNLTAASPPAISLQKNPKHRPSGDVPALDRKRGTLVTATRWCCLAVFAWAFPAACVSSVCLHVLRLMFVTWLSVRHPAAIQRSAQLPAARTSAGCVYTLRLPAHPPAACTSSGCKYRRILSVSACP